MLVVPVGVVLLDDVDVFGLVLGLYARSRVGGLGGWRGREAVSLVIEL